MRRSLAALALALVLPLPALAGTITVKPGETLSEIADRLGISMKRLMELNPHSFRRIVGTLLEVNGRGYWETSDENIAQLQEIYQEIEDRIEGVTEQ